MYEQEHMTQVLYATCDYIRSTGSTRSTLSDFIKTARHIEEMTLHEPTPPLIYGYYIQKLLSVKTDRDGVIWVADKAMSYAEKHIADDLKWLDKHTETYTVTADLIDDIADELGIEYDETQRAGFGLLEHGVGILTGGPGTGKTTILQGIVIARRILAPEKDIVLCAPTGKASQRMSDAIGLEATTIHKALDILPYDDAETLKARQPLPEGALVVVDEVSMVDTQLMECLMDSVRQAHAQLILVGDEDQLASVGAGQILHDIIQYGHFAMVRLHRIYRNAGSIVDNATSIRDGRSELYEDEQFCIQRIETSEELLEAVVQEYLDHYDPKDPTKTKVFTPVKHPRYLLSTRCINQALHQILHPDEPRIAVGEPVIITKNDYNIGVYNGSEGIVQSVKTAGDRITELVVRIDGEDKTLTGAALREVELSYSITVHKAQGTSCERAIIILPTEPRIMLTRRLLYVAVTRAEKHVSILTQWRCPDPERRWLSIDEAITDEYVLPRQTGLLDRLRGR